MGKFTYIIERNKNPGKNNFKKTVIEKIMIQILNGAD